MESDNMTNKDYTPIQEETPEERYTQRKESVEEILDRQQVAETERYSNLYAKTLKNQFGRAEATTKPTMGAGAQQQRKEGLSAATVSQLTNLAQQYGQIINDIEMGRIAGEEEARQASLDQYLLQENIQQQTNQLVRDFFTILRDPEASTAEITEYGRQAGIPEDILEQLILGNLNEEEQQGLLGQFFDGVYSTFDNFWNWITSINQTEE